MILCQSTKFYYDLSEKYVENEGKRETRDNGCDREKIVEMRGAYRRQGVMEREERGVDRVLGVCVCIKVSCN